jgi:predicted metal-dependent hydrolase
MTRLPDYTVRESRRAKHVNLKLSLKKGLEVIVPPGFDRRLIPDILRQKQAWIERTHRNLAERQEFLDAQPALPKELSLQAIQELWTVKYQATASAGLTFVEMPGQVLALSGQVQDESLCRLALQKWLAHKAQLHLVPLAQRNEPGRKLAFQTGHHSRPEEPLGELFLHRLD